VGCEHSVTLPRGIRAEDFKATYTHGVLELPMPAPKEAAGRKVPIQVEARRQRIPIEDKTFECALRPELGSPFRGSA